MTQRQKSLSPLVISLATILAAFFFSQSAGAATYTVTKTADTNDGVCDSDCSLREAISATNSGPGGDTIVIPAGIYIITIAGGAEDANATGDFDITQSVTIMGTGAASTIIDGGAPVNLDRVVHIIGGITVSLSGVTIENGYSGGAGGMGGGIFVDGNSSTSVAISGCSIIFNTATTGAGILNYGGGTVTISGSSVIENSWCCSGDGAGIYNYTGGTLIVTDTAVNGNIGAAGGIYNFSGSVTVSGSTLRGNAGYSTGGIYNSSGALVVTNSTLTGNSGADTGGIASNSGVATVTNTTVGSNSGGGIRNLNGGTFSVANSIVAGQQSGSDCSTFSAGFTSGGHNLESGTSCGFTAPGDLQNADPLLGPLADNGGPTQTMALLSGSPAIDTGSCVQAADQRGIVRPQGTGCDIGAYEVDMPCVLPPSGLVSWWAGDNNALDMAGGNNGTVSGATYVPGKVGQAFSLDGVDDYVNLGSSPELDLGDFTVSLWIFTDPSTNTGEQRVVSRDDYTVEGADGREYFLVKSSAASRCGNNKPSFEMQAAGASVTTICSPGALAAGWHHLAVSRSGSTAAMHIDGIQVGSASVGGGILSPDAPLVIGTINPTFRTEWFKGLVDEVHIFNRALTADEIRGIYKADSAGICKSCFMPLSGLVSRWRAEGDANDSAGTNNGTLMGGTGFDTGVLGQAFSFGGSGDYLEMPDAPSLALTGGMTLEAWFNLRTLQNSTIFSKSDYYGSEAVTSYGLAALSDGSINAALYGTYPSDWWATAAGLVTAGQWYHLALTWDGTYGPSNNVTLYLNGAPVQSWTKSGTSLNVTSESLTLGSMKPPAYYNAMDGLIDEATIYNRALTADEIAARYTCRPDATPDSFAFTAVTNATRNTLYTSDTVTVGGINVPTDISVTDGEYSIGCTGTFTSSSGAVANGDTVCVRQTSSGSYSTTTTATLMIGGTSADFNVTTPTAPSYVITSSAPGGNGTISCDSPVTEGNNSICAITPDTGYYLSALTDNTADVLGSVSGGTYTIVAVAGTHDVIATFSEYLVRIYPARTDGYDNTIQAVYDKALTGEEIHAQTASVNGSLDLNQPIAVTIRGGYGAGFTGPSGFSDINGTVTVTDGTLTVENIVVK